MKHHKKLDKNYPETDTKSMNSQKSSQDGFITMIVVIILVITAVMWLAFTRVTSVNR